MIRKKGGLWEEIMSKGQDDPGRTEHGGWGSLPSETWTEASILKEQCHGAVLYCFSSSTNFPWFRRLALKHLRILYIRWGVHVCKGSPLYSATRKTTPWSTQHWGVDGNWATNKLTVPNISRSHDSPVNWSHGSQESKLIKDKKPAPKIPWDCSFNYGLIKLNPLNQSNRIIDLIRAKALVNFQSYGKQNIFILVQQLAA
jgi:hypothetical protein